MAFAESNDALTALARIRTAARGDLRLSSVPLLVFGALALGSAPFAGDLSLVSLLYWSIAGPVGFLLAAWWYRQRRLRVGVGSGHSPYARAALAVLAAFALVLPLMAVQLPTICLVLVALAVRQRNLYLGAFAVAFGVIGGLEAFAVFDNLMYRAANALGWFQQQSGYFDGASKIVTGLEGLLLLVGGLVALRREKRAAA
ncbi:hypothetical protein GA0115240_173032 [Streptomyces sp. DvalAA-14]|uniref:hypothetical protein n=1 Tax=unclassified Streptomyces TaxID=2593676 RepID=UPI00081B3E78|nr:MULTISPECIES: hypothetical protein [unclassified Streptomyces]MYS25057.1 hypothetical protein [Streptomyces sp. SID4948]SCE51702.1 hypothetical protein GA0115240_173032 [Streptomyces sp. DvalAA-14]